MIRKANSKGFTLVELMLAMAFFSFILLFVTTGFIIVNRAYNKGLTVKLVQDEGRVITETFSREIRTSGASSIDVSSPECMSLGGFRYYWSAPIDSGATDSPAFLMKEEGKNCGDAIDVSNPTGVSMLDDRVGVQFLSVTPLGASGSAYQVKIVLSTAETDLIAVSDENAECSTDNGSQYCDVVTFTTIVSTR